ncbi:unnamed protein product [Zymoseptoria tritici ST99CH_3D1]|nr:unnamed protein product [Zymoseptoria tritici ST99CH_3D1]
MILLPRDDAVVCPSTQVYHDKAYVAEVITWTVVGILAFVARYIVRLRVLSWRHLHGDDWFGIAVLVFFAALTGCKLGTYHFGANKDFTERELLKLSECQLARVELGSKLQIAAWYFYASFLWGLKAMVLFLFSRLSLPSLQRRLLHVYSVIAAVTWLVVILTISLSCRPFSRNWGTVPFPPHSCSNRTQNFYTASVLNIVTDALILSIALPLIWNLRVPFARKVALILLLCSGIFVISAAIVALLMSLLDVASTLNTNLWATREEIAGILAVNAPILKPVFHRSFWHRDFDPHRTGSKKTPRALPPPLVDPMLQVVDIAEPQPVRRLGVLSSIRSAYFAGLKSSKGSSSSGTGTETKVTSSAGPWMDSFADGGHELKHVDSVWSENANVFDLQVPEVRVGPQPLLPEPADSLASRGNSRVDLHVINEEDGGEGGGRV